MARSYVYTNNRLSQRTRTWGEGSFATRLEINSWSTYSVIAKWNNSMRWLREQIGCNVSKARKGRAMEGEPVR